MKRIVNGRVYDTENCLEVGQATRRGHDPVTGAEIEYRETLYREVTLKPGETVDTAYRKGTYSYRWDESKVDTRRGAFVLVVRRGWDDDTALFLVFDEKSARKWLEENRPSDIETYEKFFGPCETQFSSNGQSGLATETISRLESKISSQQWDLEAKDRSIKEKDAAIGAKDAEIADLRKKLEAMEAGLS